MKDKMFKTSITIDKEVKERIYEYMEKTGIRSFSNALELLVKNGLDNLL